MKKPIKFTAKSQIALIQAVQKVFPEDNYVVTEVYEKLPNGKHTITVREVDKPKVYHMHDNYYMVNNTMVQLREDLENNLVTNPVLSPEDGKLLQEYITKACKASAIIN